MKYKILVKADTNDGDYITKVTDWTEKNYTTTYAKLIRICKAIKDCKIGHNWQRGDCANDNQIPEIIYKDILSEEDIDFMDDLSPYGEYGIHTIESVKILTIEKEENVI